MSYDSKFDMRAGMHAQITGTVTEDMAGGHGFAVGVHIPCRIIPITAERDYQRGEEVEIAAKFVRYSDLEAWAVAHPRPAANTPLDREIREVDAAFEAFKSAYVNARTGGATREEVQRYAIALETLIRELRDVAPYSENA